MHGQRLGLILTKTALVITLAGLCFFGREKRGWPLVNWTMYSDRGTPYPESERSEFQIRVTTRDGNATDLWPWEILPMDRYKHVKDIVQRTLHEPDESKRRDCQIYVARLLAGALATETRTIRRVELRRISWATQPMENPPMNRDEPIKERTVGFFEIEEGDRP